MEIEEQIIYHLHITLDHSLFFEIFEWDEGYTAVVIGESTRIHLPMNARCKVADRPLIDVCILKAKEILLLSNSK